MWADESIQDWFLDYANPTGKEMAVWAQDPNAFEPSQDWDLMVGTCNNILYLASLSCIDSPQREFLVHYLHVATADAFNFSRDLITDAIAKIPTDTFEDVLEWKAKAQFLIEHPKSFNEKDWLDYMYNCDAR